MSNKKNDNTQLNVPHSFVFSKPATHMQHTMGLSLPPPSRSPPVSGEREKNNNKLCLLLIVPKQWALKKDIYINTREWNMSVDRIVPPISHSRLSLHISTKRSYRH